MSDMKIQIGAEVGGALSGLQAVANSFKVVEVGSQKTGLAILNLQQQVQQFGGGVSRFVPPVIASFTNLQQKVQAFGGGVASFRNYRAVWAEINNTLLKTPGPANQAAEALQRLQRSTNAAMGTTINMGRILQDLPYGFLGIANNLNPLLESFQRLKSESGSTGGALKALGASLMGAGGLGFAFSLVTFGLAKLSMGHRSAKEASEEHKKEVSAASEKQREFKQSLDSAAQAVINQAGNLTSLKNIMLATSGQTTTLTKDVVNLGVAQLLFDKKNAAIQNLLSVELEKQLRLRKQLRPFAGVKDVSSIVPKITEREAINPYAGFVQKEKEKIADAKSDLQTAINESFGLDSLFKDLFDKNFKASESGDDKSIDKLISKAKQISDSFKGLIDISFEVSEFDTVKEQFNKASSFLSKFASEDFNILIDPELTLNETELRKQNELILRKIGAGFIVKGITTPPIPIEPQFQIETGFQKKEVEARFKDLMKDWPEIKINVPVTPVIKLSKEAQDNAAVIAAAQKLGQDTAKAFNSGMQSIANDSLVSLGEIIGDAISSGDVKEAFKSFAISVGSGIQAIGKQFIAFGTAALFAKKALDTLFSNPVVAIAAGTALVAAGAALKNVVSNGLPGRAIGGRVNKGEPYIVGEVGREMFVPDTSGRILPNSALGQGRASVGAGSMTVNITGTLYGEGTTLKALLAQVDRSQNRLV